MTVSRDHPPSDGRRTSRRASARRRGDPRAIALDVLALQKAVIRSADAGDAAILALDHIQRLLQPGGLLRALPHQITDPATDQRPDRAARCGPDHEAAEPTEAATDGAVLVHFQNLVRTGQSACQDCRCRHQNLCAFHVMLLS